MTAIAVVTTVGDKKEARYQAVESAIRDMHSYELPAIYAVAIGRIFAPYAAWIEKNTA